MFQKLSSPCSAFDLAAACRGSPPPPSAAAPPLFRRLLWPRHPPPPSQDAHRGAPPADLATGAEPQPSLLLFRRRLAASPPATDRIPAGALRKEPLTVYGDGKQTRSFQYVSDLVEELMRLMEGDHIGPFNLGNPGKFTMLELTKVVQDTIDHDGEFNNTIMMMVC
ncbi:hypothetical protein ZWY2020_005482 [Hordeum vulgare]|nr:hypothetical protein ZWY2020_005482 [Hordeum vulgare]